MSAGPTLVTADIDALRDAVGYVPATPIEVGLPRFVAWYRDFYAA